MGGCTRLLPADMSLGAFALGCEDALRHLINYVFPNIFETSPHVINAVFEAIEGLKVAARTSAFAFKGVSSIAFVDCVLLPATA